MSIHIYLSLYPESLIASMLPPVEFGRYLSVGTTKRESLQEAIYFELDRSRCESAFDLSDVEKRCVAHSDGEPKHTVYYSIYRVLERVPLEAIGNLYLVTRDGKVLTIGRADKVPGFREKSFLYQEIAPVNPLIVSLLNPVDFTAFITDEKRKMHLPKICFVDLRLGELADDPENGSAFNLPYRQLDNLRKCLIEILNLTGKKSKTVIRSPTEHFLYRVIRSGFYVGSSERVLYYPFPSEKELNSTYYEWWRSASQ